MEVDVDVSIYSCQDLYALVPSLLVTDFIFIIPNVSFFGMYAF